MPRARCRRSRSGFTIVELLTAAVVMAFTLLGVYAVFRQALAAEQQVSARWRERAAAEAVATHLAETLERLVRLPENPPMIASEVDGGKERQLTCTVMGDGWSVEDPAQAAIQRRRYTWGFEDEARGQVHLQVIPLAGTVDLAIDPRIAELPEAQRWAVVSAERIADGVDGLLVEFRPRDDPNARWERDWKDADRPFVVRVRVRVGDQTVERVIAPAVTAPLIESGGGGA